MFCCYFLSSVGSVIPGAGAFEVAVNAALTEFKKSVKGRARLGVQVRNLTENITWNPNFTNLVGEVFLI